MSPVDGLDKSGFAKSAPDGGSYEADTAPWPAELRVFQNEGRVEIDFTDGKSVNLGGLTVPGSLGSSLGLGSTLTQHESDWYDAFVAFFPSKNLSITMAYAMLGDITLTPNQNGYYISLQASF